MKKQIVIIGLGRFGTSLANSLTLIGHEVLGIDRDERRVQSATTLITHAVQADATDESALSELGVRNFDIAVVAIGSNIQSSVLAVVLLKGMGIRQVAARANNKTHGDILRKIGADKVVFPEEDAGNRLAHEIQLPDVSYYVSVTQRYGIVAVDAGEEVYGRTLADLGAGPKAREEVAVLLLQRGNKVIVTPGGGEVVRRGDRLIIAGGDDNLEAFLARALAPGSKQP